MSTVASVGGWFRPTGLAIRDGRVYILERAGDYWGLGGVLVGAPFVADLVGHPRVRALRSDGSVIEIARITGTTTRAATALALGLVTLAAVWLVRLRAIRRSPPRGSRPRE